MIKPKKNPVTKLIGAAAKAVAKNTGKKTLTPKLGAKKVTSKSKPAVAKLSPYSEGIKAKVSDNVTVRIKAKPNYEFSKDLSTVNKIAQQNAKSSGSAKANARGLKAANKPVSKNNRDRFGDGEMRSYLKSAKPARANRTRSGNTTKKK